MCVIKEMFVFSLRRAGRKMRNIDSELNGIGDIIMYLIQYLLRPITMFLRKRNKFNMKYGVVSAIVCMEDGKLK